MIGSSKYLHDSNSNKSQALLEVKGHLPKHDAYGSALFSIHRHSKCKPTTFLFYSLDGDTSYTCIWCYNYLKSTITQLLAAECQAWPLHNSLPVSGSKFWTEAAWTDTSYVACTCKWWVFYCSIKFFLGKRNHGSDQCTVSAILVIFYHIRKSKH